MRDILLTPSLARAARALIDWQQSDLAACAGISLTALKAYEKGGEKTRPSTVKAIQTALEGQGIEFPLSGGLRKREDVTSIVRYSGPDFIVKWNEDIFAAVRGPGHEILTASASEEWWYHPTVREANKSFLAWLEREKINIKSLIPKSHGTFNLPKKFYRTLPLDKLGKVTYCLYGDRLAFIIWKKRQVIVLRDSSVVETFRDQFMHLWKQAKGL